MAYRIDEVNVMQDIKDAVDCGKVFDELGF